MRRSLHFDHAQWPGIRGQHSRGIAVRIEQLGFGEHHESRNAHFGCRGNSPAPTIDRIESDPCIDRRFRLRCHPQGLVSTAGKSNKEHAAVTLGRNRPTARPPELHEPGDGSNVTVVIRQGRVIRHGHNETFAGQKRSPVGHPSFIREKTVHNHGQRTARLAGLEIKIDRYP